MREDYKVYMHEKLMYVHACVYVCKDLHEMKAELEQFKEDYKVCMYEMLMYVHVSVSMFVRRFTRD